MTKLSEEKVVNIMAKEVEKELKTLGLSLASPPELSNKEILDVVNSEAIFNAIEDYLKS